MLRGADAPRVRWRNDGGWTREVHRQPADVSGTTDVADMFDWRLSIAEVEANGAFSAFDGYDRVLVLLDGAGMDLHFTETGERVELRPGNRCARFAGEVPIEAVLVDGATTDCNLIWRRDAYQVTVHEGMAGAPPPIVGEGVRGLVYVVDGRLVAPDGAIAGSGDLLVGDLGESLPGRGTGRLLTFLLAPPG